MNRGTPGCAMTKSTCARNIADSASSGVAAGGGVLSLCSRVSRTQRMAASQMASLVGKCLNTAPCVTPMAEAMSVVVISAGLRLACQRSAVATISVWRSSVGRRVCMVRPVLVSNR
jgi:hypothetical protein